MNYPINQTDNKWFVNRGIHHRFYISFTVSISLKETVKLFESFIFTITVFVNYTISLEYATSVPLLKSFKSFRRHS